MKSAGRIFFGVLCGMCICLSVVIFGRAIRQYAIYLTGGEETSRTNTPNELPINTDIYHLDTSDVITDRMLNN